MGFATHILVAFDFSKRADVALDRGRELAQRFGAKLTVAHVRDTSVPIPAASGERLESAKEVDDTLEGELAALCRERVGDTPVETTVLEADDIAETLCAYARERQVDLLVAGNQGVSGIVRLLMGSVAEEIVRHAHCAVLIVRQEE